MNLNLCFLVLIYLLNYVKSARILGVFQMPSVSHQCVFQAIWKELSLRGHQVTVVTSHPLKDPKLVNLKEIDMSSNRDVYLRHGFQYFMNKENTTTSKIEKIFALNYELSEGIFRNKEFKKIYENPNEKFDLILVQIYINPIFISLGARFNAPVIGISSMGGYIGSHFAMGNPNHPALYSEMFLPYHGELKFFERMYSLFYYLWVKTYLALVAIPKCDKIVKKYLGNNMPYMGDQQNELSALFLTTNPILYEPRPKVPTIVELNQLHLKPKRPLPKDLKALLDKSKDGVIYFSLGSNVQSVNMPERLRKVLIAAFSELPYTILWKWESDNLPNKPKNVITRKWLSQEDVLAHPNVKVFVTQCGLQSLEETFAAGVPIVGLPFIADQEMNIRRLSEYGAGVQVDYLTVTKEGLKRAILEVAQNDTYRQRTVELNNLINDKPRTSLEEAVWWVEYVIRHNGTKHLRSPTLDISWCHFLLLDVIGVALTVLIIIFYTLRKLSTFMSDKKHKLKCN